MASSASLFTNSFKSFLIVTLFCSLQFFLVQSKEFEVGEGKGWEIPSSKNIEFYNQWASKNRFQINDTVHFKYKKDSVLVVTDSEYEKCRSVHPIFFSNNGDSFYEFDHSGLFYFISGVAGHCERGQKMIVKVLEHENPPPPANTTDSPPSDVSGAVSSSSSLIIVQFVMSVFGFLFIQS